MQTDETSRLTALAGSFAYPLLSEQRGVRFIEAFATCFFVRINGAEFLVSAAHALKDFNGASKALLTRTDHALIELPANIASTTGSGGDSDHIDLAVIPLKQGFCVDNSLRVVEDSMFARDIPEGQLTRVACGFPGSRNKKVLSRSKVLHLRRWAYVDVESDATVDFTGYRKTRADHIAMRLDHGLSDRGALQVRPVHPRGMSGGPVWEAAASADLCSLRLRGIFIEMHKRSDTYLAFATKVHHLRGFVSVIDFSRFAHLS